MDPPLPPSPDRQRPGPGTLPSVLGTCPRCGSPMESGFAVVGQWMNWVHERGVLDAGLWKGDKLVTWSEALGAAHVPGVRCRNCSLVALDLAAIA
jgi:hypothetical protein